MSASIFARVEGAELPITAESAQPRARVAGRRSRFRIRWGKIFVFLLCLAPFSYLCWKTYAGLLGADPDATLTHATGDWTLRFLLITLSVTPLRRLTRQYWLIQYRRMLGLFAFFYGCLHLLIWIVIDRGLDVHTMLGDIAKRRYITVGMLGFALMLPLAVTSTRGWIRRLGRRWTTLHRLIYFSAIAGVIHYWWLVKKDISEPRLYAIILAALLLYRVAAWMAEKKATTATPSPR
jgi:sulfoxide reductase heme-binding subunit YedZ